MKLRLSGVLLTLAFVSPVSTVPARAAGPASTSDLAAYADKLVAAVYPAGQPGAAVLVEKDGKVVLRKGYGMANLELDVPIDPGERLRDRLDHQAVHRRWRS